MIDWLRMGGYGFYVWSSYGMLALAIVIELFALRRRRHAAQRHADDIRAEQDAQAGPAMPRSTSRSTSHSLPQSMHSSGTLE